MSPELPGMRIEMFTSYTLSIDRQADRYLLRSFTFVANTNRPPETDRQAD
jgi:hypothetical protein